MIIRIFQLLNKIVNLIYEFVLNIRTRGVVNIQDPSAANYSSINYKSVLSILNSIQTNPSDVFVDLGCGKGRIVCCAARLKIGHVIGVDMDSGLCEAATQNAEKMRGRKAPVKIIEDSVINYDFGEGTIYFLYNPFDDTILKQVLTNLDISIKKNRRKIQIIYVYPVHEHLLKECGWLTMTNHWDKDEMKGYDHSVSFWEST